MIFTGAVQRILFQPLKISSQILSAATTQGKRNYYSYSPEPFQPLQGRKAEWLSPEDAIANYVKPGDHIYVHGVAATPTPLLQALASYAKDHLRQIKLYHLHLAGDAPWGEPEFEGIMRSNCFYISDNLRLAVNEGRADYTPIFVSEIPLLFSRNVINLDVALIQCSMPDHQGYCSLGTNVDCTRAAIKNAKVIIGHCNPNMPRSFGDGMIHESHFDALVHVPHSLPEFEWESKLTEPEQEIGKLIANNLIEDGATCQFGLGSLPRATIPHLENHRHLGIHSEIFTDSIIQLIENGIVTNSRKKIFPGKIVSSSFVGTRKLYDYVHDNPLFMIGDVSIVNEQSVIRQNPKVTSVNAAMEIDITGQVVSDSIGERFYSGVGGQIDFIKGATVCEDGEGKAIIGVTSLSRHGNSKIVSTLTKGSAVVATRAHVDYVVTEYGIAQLFGKNFRQRGYELIRISHPSVREQLEKEFFERFHYMPSPER